MRVLVTGGAGFIGSHLVDALVARGDDVRVLDDLSNGKTENLNSAAELVEGDIVDRATVDAAMDGVEVVFHEAALGSVKRSVENPLATDRVNVHGTLTVLDAARGASVRRLISASSSSVYGGVAPLPSNEAHPPSPKSPYAVSKLTGEVYCRVYADLMGLETVCLRYFNVYGLRQRVDSPYAAAIPLFIDALRNGTRPVVFGDGKQSRDFTYVADVVAANLLALDAPSERCSGRVFNIGGGGRYSLLDLLDTLAKIMGVEVEALHEAARPGDVRDSQADVSAAREALGYDPKYTLEQGLREMLAR